MATTTADPNMPIRKIALITRMMKSIIGWFIGLILQRLALRSQPLGLRLRSGDGRLTAE